MRDQTNTETGTENQGMELKDLELFAEIRGINQMAEDINQSLTETQWQRQLDASASITEQGLQNQEQTVGRTEQIENGVDMGGRQYPPTHPDNERSKQTQTMMQSSMAPTITVTTAAPREYIYPDLSSIRGSSLLPLRAVTTCATATVYSAGTCGHTNLVTHSNPINTLTRSTPIYYTQQKQRGHDIIRTQIQ